MYTPPRTSFTTPFTPPTLPSTSPAQPHPLTKHIQLSIKQIKQLTPSQPTSAHPPQSTQRLQTLAQRLSLLRPSLGDNYTAARSLSSNGCTDDGSGRKTRRKQTTTIQTRFQKQKPSSSPPPPGPPQQHPSPSKKNRHWRNDCPYSGSHSVTTTRRPLPKQQRMHRRQFGKKNPKKTNNNDPDEVPEAEAIIVAAATRAAAEAPLVIEAEHQDDTGVWTAEAPPDTRAWTAEAPTGPGHGTPMPTHPSELLQPATRCSRYQSHRQRQ